MKSRKPITPCQAKLIAKRVVSMRACIGDAFYSQLTDDKDNLLIQSEIDKIADKLYPDNYLGCNDKIVESVLSLYEKPVKPKMVTYPGNDNHRSVKVTKEVDKIIQKSCAYYRETPIEEIKHESVIMSEVKIGDLLSINTGYRPFDDEICAVIEIIRGSKGMFNDEQIIFVVKSIDCTTGIFDHVCPLYRDPLTKIEWCMHRIVLPL